MEIQHSNAIQDVVDINDEIKKTGIPMWIELILTSAVSTRESWKTLIKGLNMKTLCMVFVGLVSSQAFAGDSGIDRCRPLALKYVQGVAKPFMEQVAAESGVHIRGLKYALNTKRKEKVGQRTSYYIEYAVAADGVLDESVWFEVKMSDTCGFDSVTNTKF